MRADFTAFFVTGGAFALIGAWRAARTPLLGAAVPARASRSAGARSAWSPTARRGTAFPPMAAEAVMIVILALGWRMFDAEGAR